MLWTTSVQLKCLLQNQLKHAKFNFTFQLIASLSGKGKVNFLSVGREKRKRGGHGGANTRQFSGPADRLCSCRVAFFACPLCFLRPRPCAAIFITSSYMSHLSRTQGQSNNPFERGGSFIMPNDLHRRHRMPPPPATMVFSDRVIVSLPSSFVGFGFKK